MSVEKYIADGTVSVSDLSEDLYMVHFVEGCQNLAGRFRGDVFSWDKNECVCPSTGLISETTWTPGQNVDSAIEWMPGTIVRLFFFGNRWHMVTNRRLGGFFCAWDKEPFGVQLVSLLGVSEQGSFYSWLFSHLGLCDTYAFDHWCATQLNTNNKYVLSISTDESIPAAQHGAYLLGIFDNNNMFVNTNQMSSIPAGLKYLRQIDTETFCNTEPQFGYLVRDESTGQWTKYLNKQRSLYQFVVGNELDLRRRYHETIQTDPDMDLFKLLLEMKPEVADIKLQDDEDWENFVRDTLVLDCMNKAQSRGQLTDGQMRVWKKLSTLYSDKPSVDFPFRFEAVGLWRQSLNL